MHIILSHNFKEQEAYNRLYGFFGLIAYFAVFGREVVAQNWGGEGG
jgi:hypothetical protein